MLGLKQEDPSYRVRRLAVEASIAQAATNWPGRVCFVPVAHYFEDAEQNLQVRPLPKCWLGCCWWRWGLFRGVLVLVPRHRSRPSPPCSPLCAL